jgi:hypothetical protein
MSWGFVGSPTPFYHSAVPAASKNRTLSHAQSLRSFEAAEVAEERLKERVIFLAWNG